MDGATEDQKTVSTKFRGCRQLLTKYVALAQAAVVALAREFGIMSSVHYANDELLALVPPGIDTCE